MESRIKPYYQDNHNTLYNVDFRKNELPDESVQCVVTSPPYWGLRKYSGAQELIWGGDKDCEHEWVDVVKPATSGSIDGCQLGGAHKTQDSVATRRPHKSGFCSLCGAWKGAYGLEPTPEMYVQHTIEILREIKRVLRKDGVVFWNIGDSYSATRWSNTPSTSFNPPAADIVLQKQTNLPPKNLCLIPFRVAIAAQEDGWWVRSVIIWSKPNPMPESVTDRPTESHEYILMLTKTSRYYWDAEAVRTGYLQSTIDRADDSQVTTSNPDRPVGFKRSLGTGANLKSVWEFPTQPFSDWDYDWSSADYVGSDGKPYIASEDCPLHGQYHGWQKKQKELNDGQPNLELPRITDIPSYLWSKLQSEPASTLAPDADQIEHANLSEHIVESNHDHKTSEIEKAEIETPAHIEGTQTTPASSSDCFDQERSPTATERSKQNHKSISPIASHDKPSDEKASRIPDNSQEYAGSEPHHGKGESRTLGDFSQDGLFSQIPDHNFDIQRQPLATPDTNYTCSCKISQGSHFAVFPEKLPEICIKAATPEVGCCSKCGAPWERITEDHREYQAKNVGGKSQLGGLEQGKRFKDRYNTIPETRGWQPTCKCNADKVPSVVLDPFSGAGTTLWVAKTLGRKADGYETSEEYCRLIVNRVRQQVML